MKVNNIKLSNKNLSPLQYYNSLVGQDDFIFDENQQQAIQSLDKLWQDIIAFANKRNGLLGKILSSAHNIPKSIYIWGDVGRGKSFLMDIFYNCLPDRYKSRIHFHEFMDKTHKKLSVLKHKDNPLDIIALELSKKVRILCFDEFHVNDIADAMILGNLLSSLIKNKIIIVITSNYEPNQLYEHGLNRSSFLTTIDLIYQQFNILHIDGKLDYRTRDLANFPVFYIPNSVENNKKFEQMFHNITAGKTRQDNIISILGREIVAIGHFDKVIWFDFDTLCFSNRSQQDYLFLSTHYVYIFISDIRKLSSGDKDGARRFTWLIDILYDSKVKLFLTSSCKLQDIYVTGDFANEFTRTVSRLKEMQTKNYLLSHHFLLKDSEALEKIFDNH